MKAIEMTGQIDQNGFLHIDHPLSVVNTRVKVIILVAEKEVTPENGLPPIKEPKKQAVLPETVISPNQVYFPSPLTESEQAELMKIAMQPTPKHIDVEELAKEQGYSTEKWREALLNIDHSLFEEESLEELLNSLTK